MFGTYELGYLYDTGQGVTENFQKAAEWYQLAGLFKEIQSYQQLKQIVEQKVANDYTRKEGGDIWEVFAEAYLNLFWANQHSQIWPQGTEPIAFKTR